MSITPTGIGGGSATSPAVGVLKKSTTASLSVVGLLPSPQPEVIDLRPLYRIQGSTAAEGHLQLVVLGLSGQVDGTSEVIANVFVAMVPEAAAGTSAAVGDLTPDRKLQGASAGSAAASGAINIEGPLPNGTSNGTSTVSGAFDSYYAEVTGTSDAVGVLAQPMRLAGGVSAFATVGSVPLYRLWTLHGFADGTSSVTLDPDMEYYNIPPGHAGGEALVEDANLIYLNVAYYGESDGASELVSSLGIEFSTVGSGTSNGLSTVKGEPRVMPWDLDVKGASGNAYVSGRITLDMVAGIEGSPTGVAAGSGFLAWLFTLEPPEPIHGQAAGEGLLFVNDSGLIRGNSRVEANVSYLNIGYEGTANGFTRIPLTYRDPWRSHNPLTWPLTLNTPADLSGMTVGTYSGVGSWHPGTFTDRHYYRYYDSDGNLGDEAGFVPFPLEEEEWIEDPLLPGHYTSTGSRSHGHSSWRQYNNEYINVAVWDGTETSFTMSVSDEKGDIKTHTFPPAMYRQYRLMDPGEIGGWYVDTDTWRFPGMASVVEAEAGLNADLLIELPNALYGGVVGQAVVTASLSATTVHLLTFDGNATAQRVLIAWFTGVALKGHPKAPGRGRSLRRLQQQRHHYT